MLKKIIVVLLAVFVGLVLHSQSTATQRAVVQLQIETETKVTESSSPFFVEYGIAGKPTSLAVEKPHRVWVTLPDIDAIGVVSVTQMTGQTITSYEVTTYYLEAGSKPYDIAIQGNTIWFTAYGTNKIGRLNSTTNTLQTYTLADNDSGPRGIRVASNGIVWFTQQKANKLGKLDPSSGAQESYAFPLGDGGLDRVATFGADSIWFTAPKVNRVVKFDLSQNMFIGVPTLPYTQPTGLALESADIPWVSVTSDNRIGRYAPGTLAFWRWDQLLSYGTDQAGPGQIALTSGGGARQLFYANETTQRVGRVHIGANTTVGRIQEAPAPGNDCTPLDIKADSDGNAWFTCGATNTVVYWKSPFLLDIYIPIISR
jgi:virginiamycin B lyase